MKLPSLLSRYLREQKTLSLPGIGIFNLTGPFPTNDEESGLLSSHINFENKKIREADDNLINFIKQETGKIKPLAIADLDCYITSGMELLNMGKPFYLEGIGSIQKKKDGQLEFIAGENITTRLEPAHPDHDKKVSVFEEGKYEPKSNPWQKILALVLVLAGLAIVLLGGYYLYNKSNNANASNDDEQLNDAPIQQPIVDSVASKPDSTIVALTEPGTYKFILERTGDKARAMKRFSQLKSLMINVKMETTDSTNFKLYFVIPATASDTVRIKDSLSNYYGKKISIE